jgi:membrane protease subunit HflC
MIAERKQIAEKFRSEGQGEARKIEGEREREMKKITSEHTKPHRRSRAKQMPEATQI